MVRRGTRLSAYSSIKRFLRRLDPGEPRATLRLEVDPGTEAQVDFGVAGQLLDPDSDRAPRAWVFVMTLSCSRHQYAELVFEQTIDTWLRLHRAAFEFSGGVPRRVVLDNLRAAIVHAAALRSRGPARLEQQLSRAVRPPLLKRDHDSAVSANAQSLLRHRRAQHVPTELLQAATVIGQRRSSRSPTRTWIRCSRGRWGSDSLDDSIGAEQE